MISSFLEFIKKITNSFEHIEIDVNLSNTILKTTFSLNVKEKNFFYENLDDVLFDLQDLVFYIESIKINTKHDFLRVLDDELENGYAKIRFILQQDFLNNIPNVYIFNEECKKKFIDLLINNIKISYFDNVEYKINIICDDSNFERIDTAILSSNAVDPIYLDDNTVKYIKAFYDRSSTIMVIPDALQHLTTVNFVPIIRGQLSQLANNITDSKYRFIGKKTLEIETSHLNQNEDMKGLYEVLNSTLEYIFEDTKTLDQKLTFYRKTLLDQLTKDECYEIHKLDKDYFSNALNEAESVYDAFQDGEVSTFLKEKKEVIKEYISLSKDIIGKIDSLKSNLIRNFITLLALFISNIALKTKGITDTKDQTLILFAALLFVLLLIVIHFINDRFSSKTLDQRIRVFDSHFKFISNSSKDLKNDLKDSVEKEIKNYKQLLNISCISYFIIFGLLFLLLYKTDGLTFVTNFFKTFITREYN